MRMKSKKQHYIPSKQRNFTDVKLEVMMLSLEKNIPKLFITFIKYWKGLTVILVWQLIVFITGV